MKKILKFCGLCLLTFSISAEESITVTLPDQQVGAGTELGEVGDYNADVIVFGNAYQAKSSATSEREIIAADADASFPFDFSKNVEGIGSGHVDFTLTYVSSKREPVKYFVNHGGKVKVEGGGGGGKPKDHFSFTGTISNAKLMVDANGRNLVDIEDPNTRYAYINSSAAYDPLKIWHECPKKDFDITYTLTITYQPRTKTLPKQTKVITAKKKPGEKWDIPAELVDAYYGGKATLKCTYKGASEISDFVFYIRGNFLEQTRTDLYIKGKTADPAIEWMPIGIARHETGTCKYAHFNKSGKFNAGDADVMHTPNEAGNADGGVGLFQLTNTPTPDNRHFWSWKVNSDEGIKKLKQCHTSAIAWMKKQRSVAAMSKKGREKPFTKYAITFGDGKDHPMEHAVAIKAYNGLGGKTIDGKPIEENGYHFCYFDENNQEWAFQEIVKVKSEGKLVANCYVQKVVDAYVAGGK